MSIWGEISDTIGGAWDTVKEGGQEWLKNEVGDWTSEQSGRPETVNQEPAPNPYAGDAAAAQQRADAMQQTLAQWKTPAMLLMGAVAVYLIVERL